MASRSALVLVVGALFGCAGVLPMDGTACCTVDELVELHGQGVEPGVLIDTLRTSGTDLDLTADDIVRLTQAGVPRAVIDVANGGPCVCGDTVVAPEPTAPRRPGDDTPLVATPGVQLEMHYAGGKSFKLENRTTTSYTNLKLVLNGTYQYRLDRLNPRDSRFVRIARFTDMTTAATATGVKLESLVVQCDQGVWTSE